MGALQSRSSGECFAEAETVAVLIQPLAIPRALHAAPPAPVQPKSYPAVCLLLLALAGRVQIIAFLHRTVKSRRCESSHIL